MVTYYQKFINRKLLKQALDYLVLLIKMFYNKAFITIESLTVVFGICHVKSDLLFC